jgi:hypothetical protein
LSGPKTRAEAVALKEVSLFEEGILLGGGGIEGDSIIAFVDDDGVSKRVECIRRSRTGPDEWVKVRM